MLTKNLGWSEVYGGKILSQKDQLYELGDLVGGGVEMTAGETRSFYVFSKKGLLYKKSDDGRRMYAEDDAVGILEGQATKGLFRKPLPGAAARFAGVLRYRARVDR